MRVIAIQQQQAATHVDFKREKWKTQGSGKCFIRHRQPMTITIIILGRPEHQTHVKIHDRQQINISPLILWQVQLSLHVPYSQCLSKELIQIRSKIRHIYGSHRHSKIKILIIQCYRIYYVRWLYDLIQGNRDFPKNIIYLYRK